MTDIVLLKGGKPVDLNDHPSLLALLHANHRAVQDIDKKVAHLNSRHEELKERAVCYERMGLPLRGIRQAQVGIKRRIKVLGTRRQTYEKGYMEMPEIDGEFLLDEHYSQSLPVSVPMDVVRALDHAYKTDLFDQFRVVRRGPDPLILGRSGGAWFYIASWR